MLTLLYKTDQKTTDGSYLYKYRCYCGVEFLTIPRNVRIGKTKSCGCFKLLKQQEFWKSRVGKLPSNALLDPTESSFNALYGQYKKSAQIKNLDFTLSKEEFRILTKTNCHYCGVVPSTERRQTKFAREPYIYNGIDRKDNKIGYVLNNCLPCCFICNYLKSDWSYEDFLAHINKIAHLNPIVKSSSYIEKSTVKGKL